MERSQMGSGKLGSLLMIFMYLYMFVSCYSLDHEPLLPSPDSLKAVDQLGNNYTHEHEPGTRKAGSNNRARSDMVLSSKIAHGGFGGEHANGGSSGFGDHGNNGGSGTPSAQGGTSVIPIYAGGAASNHHPNTHHSAGSCNQDNIGILTFILSALVSLVHLYRG